MYFTTKWESMKKTKACKITKANKDDLFAWDLWYLFK